MLTHRMIAAFMIAGAFAMTAPAGPIDEGKATMEIKPFGKLADGTEITQYTLHNGKLTAKVINYGAILTHLVVPDATGKPVDVVLGFDDLASYEKGHPFFGATVGRF